MKIESGKYYRTRDGRKVGPMKDFGWGDGFPWNDESVTDDYFSPEGKAYIGEDLIAEWQTLTPHQQRTAEMINVMQAYVDGEKVEWSLTGLAYHDFKDGPIWRDDWHYRIAPSTTQDTIDWSHVAPEFKWMARNMNGTAFLHESEPRILPSNRWTSMASAMVSLASYRRGTCDWKDSLVKRPE